MTRKILVKDLLSTTKEIISKHQKIFLLLSLLYAMLDIASSKVTHSLLSFLVLILLLFVSVVIPIVFVKEIGERKVKLSFSELIKISCSNFWISFKIGVVQSIILIAILLIFVIPIAILEISIENHPTSLTNISYYLLIALAVITIFIAAMYISYALQIALKEDLNAIPSIKASIVFVKKNIKSFIGAYTVIFTLSMLIGFISYGVSKHSAILSALLTVIPSVFMSISGVLIYHKLNELDVSSENSIL